MKKWIMSVVLLTLVLALTACNKQEAKAPEKEAAASDTDTDTVIYKADNGDIEIPKDPQRIVVYGNSYAGYPFALGVKPVGLRSFAMKNTHFAGLTDGIKDVGDDGSVESVLELNPDLIIAFATEEQIPALEKIAPVVAFDYDKRTFKEQLIDIGIMLNKQDEAEQWITEWDAKIAADKDKVQEKLAGKTVSILGVTDKDVFIYSDRWGRGGEIIYGEFGLKAPDIIQKEVIEGKGWGQASLELLPEYAGDYIFIEDGENYTTLKETEMWKSLPAVQNNHVYTLDSSDSYFNDPISLEAQRKFILKSLLEE